MQNELIVYSRNKNGNPNGCLVAEKISDDLVRIGWSAYNLKDEDRDFSKENALRIARGRLDISSGKQIPMRMHPLVSKFIGRCKKYFKVDEIQVAGRFY